MKKNLITYFIINILVCLIYFVQYYGNYKVYNVFHLIFPESFKFSEDAQFNIDILFKDSSNFDQSRDKLINSGMPYFKKCLISEISKQNHSSITELNWKIENHTKIIGRTTVSLEFLSNVSKKIEVKNLEKCASTYKPALLKTINSRINIVRESIEIVEKFEKVSENEVWKLKALIDRYNLPYLNKIKLNNLLKTKEKILKNEKDFIYFDIDNSYSLLKSSFKEKIEILISLLLIVNVLIYSAGKLKQTNLKRIKRRIFK